MKRFLMRVSAMLSAAALLVGLSVVSSCNDTKDDVKKEEVKELPNCLYAADTTINLVYGAQRFLESAGGPFGDNGIIFIVLFNKADGDVDPAEESGGIGLGFCIDKADTALVAGAYPFSDKQSPVGTLIPMGSYYSTDGGKVKDIVSGEAVVKLSGEIYEITFVGKDTSDNEVKAHYKGKLKWTDGK